MQGGQSAGALPGHGDAIGPEPALEVRGEIRPLGCLEHVQAEAGGDLEAVRQAVDHDDRRRPADPRRLRGDEADRPGTEHDRRVPHLLAPAVLGGVDADRPHLADVDAIGPVQHVRHPLRRGLGRRHRRELGMAPIAPHPRTNGRVVGSSSRRPRPRPDSRMASGSDTLGAPGSKSRSSSFQRFARWTFEGLRPR